MPVDLHEFLEGVAILADNHNMRVTLKQSGKGAMVCGVCSFIGGLIAGPLGLAVGGTVGGITAYRMTDFRPVGDIIRNDLTPRQKELLHEHIVNTVRQIQPTDVVALLPLLMNSASVQQAVIKTVISFVQNEMRMHIAQ